MPGCAAARKSPGVGTAEVAKRQLEIRLCGSGGQGLLVAGKVLAEALIREGLRVAQSQSFEPTSRGGMSRTDLVANETGVDFPLAVMLDCALILDPIAALPTVAMLKPGGMVVVDRERVPDPPDGDYALHSLALAESARALGDVRVANLVGLGALTSLGELCRDASLDEAIRSVSPSRFLELNLEAAQAGRSLTELKRPATRAVIGREARGR
jgi:2-oxoglutarate ferredoxin oxidoreductase subunit gamma